MDKEYERMKDSLSDDEFGSIIYTVEITEWPLEKLKVWLL